MTLPMTFVWRNWTLWTMRPSRTSSDGIRRFFSMCRVVREIPQYGEAGALALLGVELHAEHVVALHRGDDRSAVVGRRHDARRVRGHEVITVQEIDGGAVRDVAHERRAGG